MKKIAIGILLTAIILLGGGLRLYHLDAREYIFPDERVYAYRAKVLLEDLGKTDLNTAVGPEKRQEKFENMLTLIKDICGHYGKPGHIVLEALGFALFKNKQCGDLYLAAVFGVLTIIIVFLLSRRLFGATAALIAALYIAVSPFHVSYSRAALGQADSVFFFALAILWYISGIYSARIRKSLLILSGLSLGLAFTCHYTVIIYIIALFVFHYIYCLRKRCAASETWPIFFATIAAPLFFESLFIAGKVYGPAGFFSHQDSYFLKVLTNFSSGSQTSSFYTDSVNGWLYPLKFFWQSDGALAMLILAAGTVLLFRELALRERHRGALVLLVLVFGVYALWALVLKVGFAARIYAGLLPAIAAIIGYGITVLPRKMFANKIFAGLVSTLLTVAMVFILSSRAKDCLRYNAPLSRIYAHLAASGEKKVLSTGKWIFWEGIEVIKCRSWEEVAQLSKKEKARFLINDFAVVMDSKAAREFLEADAPVVLSYKSPMNYKPYHYEGIPEKIRAVWRDYPRLEVKLMDISGL